MQGAVAWTASVIQPAAAPERARLVTDFKALGAREVVVELLDQARLDAEIEALREAVVLHGRRGVFATAEAWWGAARQMPNFESRWQTNGHMLHLRHLAFRLAHSAAPQYDAYLYMREDNLFLPPLVSLSALAPALGVGASVSVRERAVRPTVLVDERCGFGSYSDKIYFANAAAARVLFGETFDEHARHLAAWMQGAMRAWSDPTHRRHPTCPRGAPAGESCSPNDPLQSEYALQELLDSENVTVKKVAFHRTDARTFNRSAVGLRRYCIPWVYVGCADPPRLVGMCPISHADRNALALKHHNAARAAANASSSHPKHLVGARHHAPIGGSRPNVISGGAASPPPAPPSGRLKEGEQQQHQQQHPRQHQQQQRQPAGAGAAEAAEGAAGHPRSSHSFVKEVVSDPATGRTRWTGRWKSVEGVG